jgi:hypothetical protein
LALFEPFASTKKEILICVLNKTGVGKSWKQKHVPY